MTKNAGIKRSQHATSDMPPASSSKKSITHFIGLGIDDGDLTSSKANTSVKKPPTKTKKY